MPRWITGLPTLRGGQIPTGPARRRSRASRALGAVALVTVLVTGGGGLAATSGNAAANSTADSATAASSDAAATAIAALPPLVTPTPPVPAPTDTAPAPPDPTALTPTPTDAPTSGAPTTADPTGTPTSAPAPTDSRPTATPTPTVSPTSTSAEPTASPTQSASPSASSTTVAPAPRPATPPAAATSTIPLASIVIAVVALLVAAFVLVAMIRRGVRPFGGTAGDVPAKGAAGDPATPTGAPGRAEAGTQSGAAGRAGPAGPADVLVTSAAAIGAGEAARSATTGQAEPADPSAATLVAMLVALGEAMIDCGDPVTHVQDSLARVAHAYGAPAAEIIVLPTALIVSVPGSAAVQTAVATAGTSRLRLDQTTEVFGLVSAAERHALEPGPLMAQLRRIRAQLPPYSAVTRTVGYVGLTLGLALILHAGWAELIVAGVLGLGVGLVQLAAARLHSAYQVFVPLLSAFTVAVVVFTLPRTGLDVGVFAPLIAPLVTFLPGALLTTSVIELATGQMIAGAARLAAGFMQLTLLALGIVGGAQLVGVPAARVSEAAANPFGDLAPWLGVALFGLGVVVYNCARLNSVGWVLLVLYVAYAGQVIGGLFLGGVLSAFVGAFLMTPVAAFAATRANGPPTLVSFLPAFWLLVPGALGLLGVTKILGADRSAGTDSLLTTGATMIAIAFGVLLGLAAGTLVGRRGSPGAATDLRIETGSGR